MGGRPSKLKRELAAVKEQAARAQRKHGEELEAIKRDKRELEFKLNVLQELTAQAQLDAERATLAARESEERMQALKWELVRKLTVSTAASPTASSTRTSTASSSLATVESSSPRVALSWKLRDGVALRRANTTTLAVDKPSGGGHGGVMQRPHAQSEPPMPPAQVRLQRHRETATTEQQEADPTRPDAPDAKTTAIDRTKITTSSNNNSHEESESKVPSETAVQSVTVSSASSSTSSSSSSEDEMRKPASKFPPLSRKKVVRSPTTASESKSSTGASEQSDPETNAKAGGRTRTSEREASSDRESASSRRETASRQSHGDVLAFSSDDDASS